MVVRPDAVKSEDFQSKIPQLDGNSTMPDNSTNTESVLTDSEESFNLHLEDSFNQVDGCTPTSLDEKCEIKEEISEVIKTEGDQKSYSECDSAVKTEVIAKINTEIKPKPAFKEIE